jgi:hypothetical protein
LIAAAAGVVALGAVAAAGALALARRRAPRLPPPLEAAPLVQVLLPVRDEQANVAPCLAALLAQSAPVAIRVLDDGSRDATASIVERVARSDARVELVSVPPPETGRSGKVNALAFGGRGVQAAWLLGVDADVRVAPDAVARALAAAAGDGLHAVSLAARQRVASPGEALLTPLVFALLDALLGDWDSAAKGAGAPVANGQFFLVGRSALEAIGGYQAIADEPLDDVALARRLADGGFRVGFWRARELAEVRMYSGFGATFRGWRRNLTLILGHRRTLVAAAAVLPLVPAAAALGALAFDSPAGAAIAWLGGGGASALARSGSGSSMLWGLLYPLDASVLASCLVAAARDRGRGRLASWRGRELRPGSPQRPSGAE